MENQNKDKYEFNSDYKSVRIGNKDKEILDAISDATNISRVELLHRAMVLLQEDFDNKNPKMKLLKDYLNKTFDSQVYLRKNIEETNKKIDMLISAINKDMKKGEKK